MIVCSVRSPETITFATQRNSLTSEEDGKAECRESGFEEHSPRYITEVSDSHHTSTSPCRNQISEIAPRRPDRMSGLGNRLRDAVRV